MTRFFWFWVLKLMFLSSGTSKIGSGMSYLYIGRSSRGRLTYQIAGNCHFCGLFGGSPYNPIGLRPHAAGPPSLSFGVGGLEGFGLFESTLVLSRKSLVLSRRS